MLPSLTGTLTSPASRPLLSVVIVCAETGRTDNANPVASEVITKRAATTECAAKILPIRFLVRPLRPPLLFPAGDHKACDDLDEGRGKPFHRDVIGVRSVTGLDRGGDANGSARHRRHHLHLTPTSTSERRPVRFGV